MHPIFGSRPPKSGDKEGGSRVRAAVVRAEAVRVEAVVRVARVCAVLLLVSLQSQNGIGALEWELWCGSSAHGSEPGKTARPAHTGDARISLFHYFTPVMRRKVSATKQVRRLRVIRLKANRVRYRNKCARPFAGPGVIQGYLIDSRSTANVVHGSQLLERRRSA